MALEQGKDSTQAAALTNWHWLAFALISQMGWGAYPVFLRYLQTVSNLPGLSMLGMGNLLVLLLVLAVRWRQIEWHIFRLPLLWLFGGLVVLRGVTNLLATRYTLAIYAQLIYLMTPFIVALLSRLVWHEHLPRHTFKAVTLCLLGAILMMLGNLGEALGETAVFRNDWVGIAFAVSSALFLALYMIVTRRSVRHKATGQSLHLIHLTALGVFTTVGSLTLGEEWVRWGQLQMSDWLVFGLFALGVLLGANLLQIRAIQQLGAPLVSSLMASRLISALLFANLLLGEQLASGWQLLGAGIVLTTLTWYLRQSKPSTGNIDG